MLSICFPFASSGKNKMNGASCIRKQKTEIGSSIFIVFHRSICNWHTDLCGLIIDFRKSAFDECVRTIHIMESISNGILGQMDSPMGNLTLWFCVTVDRIIWKHITMLHQNWQIQHYVLNAFKFKWTEI